MRRPTLLLAAAALLASTSARAQTGPPSGKIVGGYFEEWSIYYAHYNLADLEAKGSAAKLTHLFYAFGGVKASASAPATDSCAIADSWADYQMPYLPPVAGIADTAPLYGNFAEIAKLKKLHPALRTVISLGGGSAVAAQAFATAAATDTGRKALAASCIDRFLAGNVAGDGSVMAPGLFDGIDIDWEYPAAADTANFTLLLQEFRKQLDALGAKTGKAYSLNFNGPAGSQNYKNIDLKAAAQAVDFITMDGYDYAGTWETTTNEGSPLFDSAKNPQFGQGLAIDNTLTAYLKAGVPASKFLLGIPLYGPGWTGVPNVNGGLYQASTGPAPVLLADGSGRCTDLSGNTAGCDPMLTPGDAAYATLASLAAHGYETNFDFSRLAVSLYDPAARTFYSFDDPGTAYLKSMYTRWRVPGGLAGAFFWALKDDDAQGSIVKAGAGGLGR